MSLSLLDGGATKCGMWNIKYAADSQKQKGLEIGFFQAFGLQLPSCFPYSPERLLITQGPMVVMDYFHLYSAYIQRTSIELPCRDHSNGNR